MSVLQGKRIPLQGDEHIAPLCYYDYRADQLYFKVRWHGKNIWQSISIDEFLSRLRDVQAEQGVAPFDGIVYNKRD